ncbi:transmembrane protease serine 11D [Brachionus plicatilis]|uniref:Transmembrane protease serine 11D n=1 Tax=Brachionus plicatilis TaxID=10195 RepID=A0A3M7QKH7_BRAPC|nr:transmembrane protease serine 11D [Brachionus plicatilis]
MVDTKSRNGNVKGNQATKTNSGHVNKAYRLSDQNIYSISRQLSDTPDANGVDSSKNLLNAQQSVNVNLPNTAFIDSKNPKLTSKIADSNKKLINRPKLIIPLVIMGIVFSVAVISGIVYVIVSANPRNTNNKINDNQTIIPITTQTKTTVSLASTSLSSTNIQKLPPARKPTECGVPLVDPNLQLTRIMRGHPVVRDSWPWTVSIGYFGPRTSLPHACGGALVNKRFVVTATHCVESRSIYNLVGNPVNSHDLFGSLEKMMRVYVSVNTRSTDITAENTYRVESIIEYPNFDQSTFKNDISIIKLDRDVIDSENLNYICVPTETNTNPGTDLYAVGWGFTENNFYRASDTLNQVKIQVQSATTCGLSYLPVLQFCAGNQSLGKDTCNGDSGGPVMQQDRSKRWQLVGVVSNGDSMCTGRGIYTNVSFYHKWIQDNTKIVD